MIYLRSYTCAEHLIEVRVLSSHSTHGTHSCHAAHRIHASSHPWVHEAHTLHVEVSSKLAHSWIHHPSTHACHELIVACSRHTHTHSRHVSSELASHAWHVSSKLTCSHTHWRLLLLGIIGHIAHSLHDGVQLAHNIILLLLLHHLGLRLRLLHLLLLHLGYSTHSHTHASHHVLLRHRLLLDSIELLLLLLLHGWNVSRNRAASHNIKQIFNWFALLNYRLSSLLRSWL